jgi:hypothetical protein
MISYRAKKTKAITLEFNERSRSVRSTRTHWEYLDAANDCVNNGVVAFYTKNVPHVKVEDIVNVLISKWGYPKDHVVHSTIKYMGEVGYFAGTSEIITITDDGYEWYENNGHLILENLCK